MAAEPGEMFICDRAEKSHANGEKTATFMDENDKRRSDWDNVVWQDSQGVSIKMLLCPECLETYRKIIADQRKEMQAFMNERING